MLVDTTLRILVVDDMPSMRAIVREMLTSLGFSRIVEAEDGDQAWDLIVRGARDAESRIGLVVADWQMPGKSGLDLLRSIRTTTAVAELPFFMVTSNGTEAAIREAQAAGVTDYLVKPFLVEHFAEKLGVLFPG